jgi:hypothetical protein
VLDNKVAFLTQDTAPTARAPDIHDDGGPVAERSHMLARNQKITAPAADATERRPSRAHDAPCRCQWRGAASAMAMERGI